MPAATLFPPLSSEDERALPSHLQSKFDQIKKLRDLQTKNKENATCSSQGQGAKKDETVDPESTSSEASAPIAAERSANDDGALEQQKIRLAAETAVACETEISRLARGVAELERLVAQQESGEAMSVPMPAFPSIVPDEGSVDG